MPNVLLVIPHVVVKGKRIQGLLNSDESAVLVEVESPENLSTWYCCCRDIGLPTKNYKGV